MPRPTIRAAPPSLTAFEDMKGYLTVGEWSTVTDEDYERAFVEGRRNDTWVLTHLDLSADDLGRMLEDPQHRLRIGGYIQADSLWGRASISGTLGLFVPTDNPALRRLEYRFSFEAEGEGPLTFVGFKELSDDLRTTVLRDQQVLYFRIVRGDVDWDAVDTAPVHAIGIVNLYLWDFLRLNVLGLRVRGPDRLTWTARWLRFFLGTNLRFMWLKVAGRRRA